MPTPQQLPVTDPADRFADPAPPAGRRRPRAAPLPGPAPAPAADRCPGAGPAGSTGPPGSTGPARSTGRSWAAGMGARVRGIRTGAGRSDTTGGPGGRGRGRGRPRGGPPPQPVALALAADAADFACLSRYGLFGRATFEAYLRRTGTQLRALLGQGLEVHLRLLEPADFEDFCEAFGFAPADRQARVAYAADPDLVGRPFLYAGERLGDLLPALVENHRVRVRLSIACTALLSALEGDVRPGERLAAVFRYAAEVYVTVLLGAGDGSHLLTLRSHGPEDGEELTAAVEVRTERGVVTAAAGEQAVEAFCVTLAAGVAADGAGEMLLESHPGGRPTPLVRGWTLADGRLRPMTVAEVFAALAADDARGAGLPDGASARPGFALADRPAGCSARPAPGAAGAGADAEGTEGAAGNPV